MFDPKKDYKYHVGEGLYCYEQDGKFYNMKGEEIPSPFKKPEKFVCDKCGQEFETGAQLRGHKIRCKGVVNDGLRDTEDQG